MGYKNWQLHMLDSKNIGSYSKKRGSSSAENNERKKEVANICLSCTKKKCKGTTKCFKEMKEAKKEKGI